MSKYKLLAVCQCCGEVNVVKESDDKESLDTRCRILIEDNKDFDESPLVKTLYTDSGVTNSKDFLLKMNQMQERFDSSPDTKILGELHEQMMNMLYEVSPKYFGHDFEVVEVVAEL